MATAKRAVKPAARSRISIKSLEEIEPEKISSKSKVNHKQNSYESDLKLLLSALLSVKKGNFDARLPNDWIGIVGKIADTFNDVVEMNQLLSAELERVGRVVGKEGKITQRARFRDNGGSWSGMLESINGLIEDLVRPTSEMTRVIGAVARGDLSQTMTVEIDGRSLQGEFLRTSKIVNSMVQQLASFSAEVTRVAREVGVDGRLGGQAVVPGAAGTWRDLTDNVNQLAANLTTQVRAIAEVATAVTKGDLSRTIQVGARGEVEELKNNINEMIRNLKETTQTNAEQDWLKTNIAKFTRLLQGQRDLETVSQLILSELIPLVSAQHGVFYIVDMIEIDIGIKRPLLRLLSSYAYKERKYVSNYFQPGEGLVGQCALEKERILLTEIPGDYIKIGSGLGEAKPINIIVLPVLFESEVKAVIELASFHRFSEIHLAFLDELTESIGIVINTIAASMRTEELLKQSQSLAKELQSQQQILQKTNEELEEKARLLEEQKVEVERKNQEIEMAKSALEEKAEQLALTSKYKSEFLSNMSHELRTPLNSLLILAQQLAENHKGNLDERQREYARTIHNAGNDLLALINDILDLSKIESGTVILDLRDVSFIEIEEHMERVFRHQFEQKGLRYVIESAPSLPRYLFTDSKRLQQVLKNLLSNALKFTDRGFVALRMEQVKSGWNSANQSLNEANYVVAFSVVDTGIGIPLSKQKIVFEAFQQADSGTSRKYGGTGLGLAISRELTQLLGGELVLHSEERNGSIFTLYLPGKCEISDMPETTVRRHFIGMSKMNDRLNPELLEIPERETDAADLFKQEPQTATVLELDDNCEDMKLIDKLNLYSPERILEGKKVLIVDDDIRNIFALTSMLENEGLEIFSADNGRDAIELLKNTPDISVILMDMMMPEYDGYQTIREIRSLAEFNNLPIIALTARAMKGDKQKCIDAGASDYLAKPVNTKRLLTALRAWAS